jgi:DNA-binding NarL/FixJ family response regulator
MGARGSARRTRGDPRARAGGQRTAIRSVAAGEAIFGPGVAQRVLGFLTAPAPKAAAPFPQLSQREHDILDLLGAGLNKAGIADRMGIAPKIVANCVSSIFTKLQVTDRAQAIVRARDAGLGKRQPSSHAQMAGRR